MVKERNYREVQYASMFREACCTLLLCKYAFNEKVLTIKSNVQVGSTGYQSISVFDTSNDKNAYLTEDTFSAENMSLIRSILSEYKGRIHTYGTLPMHLFHGSSPMFKASRLKEIGSDYKLYEIQEKETGQVLTQIVTYRPESSKKITSVAWDVTSAISDKFTRECVGYSMHNTSGNAYKDFNELLTSCIEVYGYSETIVHLSELLSHLSYQVQHDLIINLQEMLPNRTTGMMRFNGKE